MFISSKNEPFLRARHLDIQYLFPFVAADDSFPFRARNRYFLIYMQVTPILYSFIETNITRYGYLRFFIVQRLSFTDFLYPSFALQRIKCLNIPPPFRLLVQSPRTQPFHDLLHKNNHQPP